MHPKLFPDGSHPASSRYKEYVYPLRTNCTFLRDKCRPEYDRLAIPLPDPYIRRPLPDRYHWKESPVYSYPIPVVRVHSESRLPTSQIRADNRREVPCRSFLRTVETEHGEHAHPAWQNTGRKEQTCVLQ